MEPKYDIIYNLGKEGLKGLNKILASTGVPEYDFKKIRLLSSAIDLLNHVGDERAEELESGKEEYLREYREHLSTIYSPFEM
jgi:hypothetical protein